jgi:pimeloyl-ACP methyl ester carboxylesterase
MKFKEQHIELNGLKVNYVEAGEGQPLLFLHNGSGFWQSWQHQLTHFAKNYHVYSFDWPGCGGSEYPNESLDLNTTYSTLKAFTEEKKLEHLHIIGNCIGASTALHFAINNCDTVDKLILFNICPGDLLLPSFLNRKRVSRLQSKPSAKRRSEKMLKIAFPELVVRQLFPKRLFGKNINKNDALFQKYRMKQKEENQKKGRIDQFFSAYSFNLLTIIEGTEIPKHELVWGVQNRIAGLKKHGYCHQKKLQSESMHLVENAGHLCMYEAPEQVNKIIEDYLSAE